MGTYEATTAAADTVSAQGPIITFEMVLLFINFIKSILCHKEQFEHGFVCVWEVCNHKHPRHSRY